MCEETKILVLRSKQISCSYQGPVTMQYFRVHVFQPKTCVQVNSHFEQKCKNKHFRRLTLTHIFKSGIQPELESRTIIVALL